jgi:hypothetical protein
MLDLFVLPTINDWGFRPLTEKWALVTAKDESVSPNSVKLIDKLDLVFWKS